MWKRPGLIDLLGLLYFVIFVWFRGNIAGDPGVGWHLKTGEWIVTHRTIPRFDPFLSSPPLTEQHPAPWIADQWLADVLLWFVYSLAGWGGLTVLTACITLSTFFLVLVWLGVRLGIPRFALFFSLFISTLVGSIQWFIRPVVVSFLLFALVYSLCRERSLLSGRERRRRALLFPAIFLLWANLHPGFVYGLLLLAFAWASECFEGLRRRWIGAHEEKMFSWELLVVLVVSFAATCMNPYGLQLYGNILRLGRSDYFLNLNAEWLSPDFHLREFLPFGLALLLFTALLLVVPSERRKERGSSSAVMFEGAAFMVFLFFGLFQRRSIPYFAVTLFIPLARLLSWVLPFEERHSRNALSQACRSLVLRDAHATLCRYTVRFALLVVFGVVTLGQIPGRVDEELAIRKGSLKILAEVVESRSSTGAFIFHSPNHGGAITFLFSPRVRPFIDDRNQLIPVERYEDFFRLNGALPGWRETLLAYGFSHLLLEKDSPLRWLIEEVGYAEEIGENEQFLLFRVSHDLHRHLRPPQAWSLRCRR